MANTTYDSVNCLEEFVMIGGTERVLNFSVYDENNTPVNLNSATVTWKACEYGNPDYAVITKTGTINGTNTWYVTLDEADTLTLSGKYIQQPVVTEASGKTHPSQQGLFTIIARIQ